MLGCPLRPQKGNILFKDFLLDTEGAHEFDHFVHHLFGFTKLRPPHGLSRDLGSSLFKLRDMICLLSQLAGLELLNDCKLVQDCFLGVLSPSRKRLHQSATLDRQEKASARDLSPVVKVSLSTYKSDSLENLCSQTSAHNCSDNVHRVFLHLDVPAPGSEDILKLRNVKVLRLTITHDVKRLRELGLHSFLSLDRKFKLFTKLL